METLRQATMAECRKETLEDIAERVEGLRRKIEAASTQWYPPEYGDLAESLGLLHARLNNTLRVVRKRLQRESAA